MVIVDPPGPLIPIPSVRNSVFPAESANRNPGKKLKPFSRGVPLTVRAPALIPRPAGSSPTMVWLKLYGPEPLRSVMLTATCDSQGCDVDIASDAVSKERKLAVLIAGWGIHRNLKKLTALIPKG